MADVLADRSTLHRLAHRMNEERVTIASRWLERLQQLLPVSRLEVFPSHQLLDHIPEVVGAIAGHLEDETPGLEGNESVIARAEALGELRHVQQASVHQLLREYRVLAELLEDFIEAEVADIDGADPRAVVVAMRRVGAAVRVLQQHTVDTFVANYTQTIERQTTQLRTFSRLVSHEMRQPLAVLQVIAQALPVRAEDDDALRMMDIFNRSVLRLADVTGGLERQARISPATDLALSERTVDLSEIAHTAAAQLTAEAQARQVEINVHPRLPAVRLDPARAELIFLNLIANGIKFSDPAKATRFVDIYPGGGDEPSVIVRDNGVGMAPTRLQTIFREFVRAHAQRDDEVHAWGLGLGLSIVRECMDHANGTVRVASIEGRGTTFKLTWPTAAR